MSSKIKKNKNRHYAKELSEEDESSTPVKKKKLKNDDDQEDEKNKKELIWDEKKRGKPTCTICFELAYPPVYSRCTCSSLMCFACFQPFMDNFSSCLICKEKLISRVRRECKGNGLETLVDQPLQKWMKLQYQTLLDPSKKKYTEEEEEEEILLQRKLRLTAPDPGELKKALEELNSKFEAERKKEEAANELFLENLKRTGDVDVLELERQKKDEDYARLLQQELDPSFSSKALLERTNSLKADEEFAQKLDAEFRKPTNDDEVISLVGPSTTLQQVKSSSAKKQGAQLKSSCWSCSKCTYIMDAKWLRCEICENPKL